MKKFLPALVLFSVLAIVAAPAVLAADQPIECVKLKRDITIGDITCNKDNIVASPNAITSQALNTNCPLTGTICADALTGTEQWGAFALLNTINTVVDWVFAFLVIIAVFYVILGAWNILTSSGAPEKVSSGRNYILYAAVGLLVAFIARAIPSLVKAIMGF